MKLVSSALSLFLLFQRFICSAWLLCAQLPRPYSGPTVSLHVDVTHEPSAQPACSEERRRPAKWRRNVKKRPHA